MNDFDDFKEYMKLKNLSTNTIKAYIYDLTNYNKWFKSRYYKNIENLYRQNILEYKIHLENEKLNAKTINHKLSALKKYNEYLIKIGKQKSVVITNDDLVSIQIEYASPTKVNAYEINKFMQDILEHENSRNNALIILMRYTGLRVSEALNIKLEDFDLVTGDCIIRGKGNKQRIIIFNKKVIAAIKTYLKERKYYKCSSSEYLFISSKAKKLERSRVNKIFRKYSTKVTPHQLRHYFATSAIESGKFATHEVAYLLGHSNIHTTLLYLNPDKEKMKKKLDQL